MNRNFVCFVLCLGLVTAALANQVSYQGILTNAGGDSLLSGTFDFSFSIYSQATGGTARWTEAHTDVNVENGVYSVILGSTTPLPDSVGADNWLQITVEGTVLTPRLPITADFRAIEARHAENSDSINHIAASTTPQPGHLYPLDNTGRFPEAVMPFTLDSIVAGQGLTGAVALPSDVRGGGRNTLDERLTINVGAGDGISVTADQVSATLGTSISTAEIENNAVTSAKVQDNTLTTADIVPSIVSSVDSVFNDGGNIDLIAGQNITIVPNDSANTITFSATAATYQEGRCIEINGNTIDNIMDIFGSECIDVDYDPATCSYDVSLDMGIEGGDCIEVEYDAATCTYQLESLLTLIGGECITVEQGLEGCNWTISVDPECILGGGEQDSVFDSEVYARSFVVTPDGTLENAVGHLTSGGKLELYGAGGDTVRISPNGTMDMIQDGVRVAGIDANGESYAKSFYVRNPDSGDTLIHLTHEGVINLAGELFGQPYNSQVRNDHIHVQGSNGTSSLNGGSLQVYRGGPPTDGHILYANGTWSAQQNSQTVAGLDSTGEIFARSFYTINAEGDTVSHLDNSGNLSLPSGAQITVGGVPIGGGIGNEISFQNGDELTLVNSGGVAVIDEDGQVLIAADGMSVAGPTGSLGLNINGTWDAEQNGVPVAGLQDNGEIHAKSFEVRDSAGGPIKLHLTNDGRILDASDSVVFDGTKLYRPSAFGNASMSGLLGFSHSQGFLGAGFDKNGFTAADFNTGNAVRVYSNGTWTAEREFLPIAALDSTGEIIAKSFQVRDSLTGVIKAHLDNDGNLALPTGAQVTIGGVPIGGSIGDQITFTEGDLSTTVNETGVHATNAATGNISDVSPSGINTENLTDGTGIQLNPNGTWQAYQDDPDVPVSGLDDTGEIFARSFEVREDAASPLLAHMYIDNGVGKITMPGGTVSTGTVFGSSTIYSSSVSGNTQLASDLSPGYMRTQTLVNSSPTAGWSFLNNGTMTARMNGQQILGVALDTYLRLYTCLAMGTFVWSFDPNYVQLAGNLMVNGFFSSDNYPGAPPLVGDFLPTLNEQRLDVATLLVIDRNSEAYVPCSAPYQTSVIGVVSPADTVNADGEIMTVTYGSTTWIPNGGERPVEVPIRIKADAKYGAIHRGDLLTTSATPGHAMLAADPKIGTIVGKALESLDSGTGEIKVMVTLQ